MENGGNTQMEGGRDFELRIERLLEAKLPNCFLSGVPVFPADQAMILDRMANELDFIFHIKQGDEHQLVIIECKACHITGDVDSRGNYSKVTRDSKWLAHYGGGPKDIKQQLRGQRNALLANIEPLEGKPHVHAVVIAAKPEGLDGSQRFLTADEPPFLELSLVPVERFEAFLDKLLSGVTCLRVQQSEILRRIRLGQPVPVLGHPEIYNAIEYCRRCRVFIDSEIFQHLEFKSERWAINGSAGMGKSVLLVYATMVLITDRYIDSLRDGTRYLQSFTERAGKIGLPALDKRRVWVVAHTDKQRRMLEQMFIRFNALYSDIDRYNEFRRVKPEFHIFSEIEASETDNLHESQANILLVDEAHDLDVEWEDRLRKWHTAAKGNYLVIACDRHQKLRLAKDETRMISGINFSLCTTKLKRNYLNPLPAYAGSLGLLFRWFTSSGPKILPSKDELRDAFGFSDIHEETSDRLLVRSRNDAHPANNWSHVLSNFPSAEDAYKQLSEFPLRKEQVLWIRFTPEEEGFNYEHLQRWSYHSVHSADAPDLLDKYVKGQEFPVVVIEGVPEMFAWSSATQSFPNDSKKAEIEMWQARRLVYLAASRTNVFLYFILPPQTAAEINSEFQNMFSQLGRHPGGTNPSGTLWDVRVSKLGELRSLDDYLDAIEAETVEEPVIASEPAVLVTGQPEMTTTTSPSVPPVETEAPSVTELTVPQGVVANEAPPAPGTEKHMPDVAPVSLTLTQSPQLLANPSAASVSVVKGPEPAAKAPAPALVTVAALAADFRRPVPVVINILRKHGFGDLTDSKLINREVGLRILRRHTQQDSAGLNPLAARLEGSLLNTITLTDTQKDSLKQL